MTDLFGQAAPSSAFPDDDDDVLSAWLNELVRYDGQLVVRKTAFQLSGHEKRGLSAIGLISALEKTYARRGETVMTAAMAFSQQHAYPSNPSRDV